MADAIPLIPVQPLFGPDSRARRATDAAIRTAAREAGFLVLTDLPADVPLGTGARHALLSLLSLSDDDKRRLWRQAFAPENENVYRGYFPLHAGILKEGMDIGPERPVAASRPGDALAEPTPLPPEDRLPGWRARMRRTFAALERVGEALMHAVARGLGVEEHHFDAAFRGGISTLRLISYPPWPGLAERYGLPLRPVFDAAGTRRYEIGGEHVDSGLVTLLQQDDAGGLQARIGASTWVDVPAVENSLVVNFGKLLERWTGGRIRATEHRVLGNDRERRSIPFFYEPRIDARIAPLPLADAEPFEPFSYGDHLWDAMSRFAEFSGVERFRRGGTGASRRHRDV